MVLALGRECLAVGTTAPVAQTLRTCPDQLLRVAITSNTAHGVDSKTPGIQQALSNAHLKSQRLYSLHDGANQASPCPK